MPIYEYSCKGCEKKFSVLHRSFSEIKQPVCSHCGGTNGERIVSQITVIKGWGDFMKNMPSWETMTDFDENDPRSVAEHLRRLKDDSGQDIGMGGEEMLARMDAGAMLEDSADIAGLEGLGI